ncbi:hypothetical protein AZI86_17640 [Bdellovibrio bacteriovorus]|uniref:Uncharacterized protein n=2 Tax=Bdellovibrio bacteriovorus TaxID=959 RepID=A0A150WF01_BDEBC|nr:hypothetical protein AZI86_17640 [Bdellovibrio bacteriovorus]
MGEPQELTESKRDKVMSQIRTLSQTLGVRQKDLAASLNLKPSQMNVYMQGKVEMKTDRLLCVLELMGIDVEKLLEQKIIEASKASFESSNKENVLAKIGRLDADNRESIFKIVKILGSK